jgi:hypothetical protein
MHHRRPIWAIVLTFALLFLGGGLGGLALNELLAPGSFVAAFIGLFTFPLVFAFGMQIWFGWALFRMLPLLIRHLRGLPVERPSWPAIPGSFIFFLLGASMGLAAGVLTALLPGTPQRLLTVAVWSGVGVAYGFACWRLAYAGYLMPPEEI